MKKQRPADPKLQKVLQSISSNLERFRKERGWTQAQITEKLETDLRWYQRLESGKHVFSLQTLIRLAAVLKVELTDLMRK